MAHRLRNSRGQFNIKDLSGYRFGRLTILNQIPKVSNLDGHCFWEFKCDCGRIGKRSSNNFNSNSFCGKCFSPSRDKTGSIVGNLYVESFSHKKHNNIYWNCHCSCGKMKVCSTAYLRTSKNASCGCKAHKECAETVAYNKAIAQYKNGASQRNLIWSLTDKDAINLFMQNCIFCHSEPSISVDTPRVSIKRNGIDRIDPSKGYTIDNVQTCCSVCNHAKNNLSQIDFLKYINKIRVSGLVKPFYLKRLIDNTGTSGTGVVAVGAILPSGKVILEWLSNETTDTIFSSFSQVERLHGHGGNTIIIMGDPSSELTECPTDKTETKTKKTKKKTQS